MSEEQRALVLSHMLCGADALNVDHCDGCREAVSDLDALIAAVRAEQDAEIARLRAALEHLVQYALANAMMGECDNIGIARSAHAALRGEEEA